MEIQNLANFIWLSIDQNWLPGQFWLVCIYYTLYRLGGRGTFTIQGGYLYTNGGCLYTIWGGVHLPYKGGVYILYRGGNVYNLQGGGVYFTGRECIYYTGGEGVNKIKYIGGVYIPYRGWVVYILYTRVCVWIYYNGGGCILYNVCIKTGISTWSKMGNFDRAEKRQ